MAFDAAVNSGVSRGAKWLQTALGVAADGKIGPATLAAARKAHPEAVIDRATSARLAWLRTLPTWGRFGKGWVRRVDSVHEEASVMAKASRISVTDATTATGGGFIAALIALLKSIFGGKK